MERPKREVIYFYPVDAEQPTNEEIKQEVAATLQPKQYGLRITTVIRVAGNGVILETFPEDAAKIKELNLQQAGLKIDTPNLGSNSKMCRQKSHPYI